MKRDKRKLAENEGVGFKKKETKQVLFYQSKQFYDSIQI